MWANNHIDFCLEADYLVLVALSLEEKKKRRREASKRWQAKNAEKLKQQFKEWYSKPESKEKRRQAYKIWYAQRSEEQQAKTRAQDKEYRADPEVATRRKEAMHEWYEANKEKQKKYHKDRRERLKKDPEWVARRNAKSREMRKRKYPEIRDRKRIERYGLTPEMYKAKWDAQKGLCDMCSKPLRTGIGGAAVDHCHKTGKVRGIICAPCNTMLGMVEGPRLAMAHTYIDRWK